MRFWVCGTNFVNFGEGKGRRSARNAPVVDAEPQGLPSAGPACVALRGLSRRSFSNVTCIDVERVGLISCSEHMIC